MINYGIKYEPLANVARGIASDGVTPLEVTSILAERGYDVPRVVDALNSKIAAMSAESRLAWMKTGAIKQAKFEVIFSGVKTWRDRAVAEIEDAFDALVVGARGQDAQFRVQSAFKNLTAVTVETKAEYLDEIEALTKLNEVDKPEK
jgi:hypothetical protein